MIYQAYVAVMAGGLTTGVLLLAAGLRATTTAAPVAGARTGGAVARWWRGTGRTAAEQRVRQARLVAGAVVSLVVLLSTGVPAAAIMAGVAVPLLPWLWNAGTAERRAIARADAVAEWTRRLADHLATGSGLISALTASAETAPDPIAGPVRALARRLRGGSPPAVALHRFAGEVDDTVAEQVVAALLLHLHDRGAQLVEVLTALAADSARVVSMRREVDAKRAQPRLTIRFMIVLAGVVTVLLWQLGLLAFYTTPAGQLLLAAGAAGFVAVLLWVNSMTRPPALQRLLTTTGWA
jgi:Flp pilus assembly protein TadB